MVDSPLFSALVAGSSALLGSGIATWASLHTSRKRLEHTQREAVRDRQLAKWQKHRDDVRDAVLDFNQKLSSIDESLSDEGKPQYAQGQTLSKAFRLGLHGPGAELAEPLNRLRFLAPAEIYESANDARIALFARGNNDALAQTFEEKHRAFVQIAQNYLAPSLDCA